MQTLNRLLILLLCASLFACASDDEEVVVASPLVDFTPTKNIKKNWSYSVKGVGDLHNNIVPAVQYGKVFLPSGDGRIVALNEKTGKKIWEADLDANISGAIGVGNGVVAVGTLDAEVIVLDEKTGKRLWKARVSSEVTAPPTVGDNTVIVNAIDGKLFCLELKSGKRRWFYDRSVPVLTLRGTGSSQIARGAAVAGFANGKVAAFVIESGGLIWEKRVASPSGRSELDRMIDIDSTPVIFGDTVYAASYNGNIVALSLPSGDVLWQRELSTYQNISVTSTSVYASNYVSHVKAMSRSNGAAMWTQNALANRNITGPTVFKGTVVVGDFEGYLHFLDGSNGRFVARIQQDDAGFLVAPVVAGETLYALSRDGTLNAYSIQ